MEGFTLSLALVDAIPVLLFGGSMILVATKFGHPLFILGAVLSTLAGCFKVTWKLVLGIWKKDLQWLNKRFLPMQITGFGFMLGSFLVGIWSIEWAAVWAAVSSFPSILLFVLWAALMLLMGWYRKNRFRNDDAKSNWTAQYINCAAQAALFLAIVLAQ